MTWFAEPDKPEGFEFGQEKIREHIAYRIAWERWAQEKLEWQQPCLGWQAIRDMHVNTRLAYQLYLDALNNK